MFITEKAARQFVKSLGKLKSPKGATVIGLYGNLGAGKTTFVQYVARLLGVKEAVQSPTFVIEKIYKLPRPRIFKQLIHIDAYRLEKPKELTALGFSLLLKDKNNLIFVEWAGKVEKILPKGSTRIFFDFYKKDRVITYG